MYTMHSTQQIKLFTFLVGQQELLAQKSAADRGKTQIVARLMVEELAFHGIRNAKMSPRV